ncbi:MAG TPA: hypothetical protein DDY13_18770 [Cytophagales bacterium]|jgi:hypothetical protein|nr:hypothetical protein [Cytophagales bacterium]
MKTIIAVLLWFILFSISWPLALILLFFFVLAWIILIPFKIIGFTLEAIFKLIGAILLFPFRVIRSL